MTLLDVTRLPEHVTVKCPCCRKARIELTIDCDGGIKPMTDRANESMIGNGWAWRGDERSGYWICGDCRNY